MMVKLSVIISLLLFLKVNSQKYFGGVLLPFETCRAYKLGGKVGIRTHDRPLNNGSVLAIYPLNKTDKILQLSLMLPKAMYKIRVEGPQVKLERCNIFGRNCQIEDEGGSKHPDYIIPEQWNIITVYVRPEKVEIFVGERLIKTMSISHITSSEKMYWRVVVHEDKPVSELSETDYSFLVQFMCKEYITRSSKTSTHTAETTTVAVTQLKQNFSRESRDYFNVTPEFRQDKSTETKSESDTITTSLIIGGVIIAVVIVTAAGLLSYFIFKKRFSAKISSQYTK